MKVISRKKLKEFARRFPDAEPRLNAWFHEVTKAKWRTPANIKEKYGSASILKKCRVVFNIRGNRYRIIVRIDYQRETLVIRFVGTHEEYNKIDVEKV